MDEDTWFVICDLDGCLSDDRWRRSMIPAGAKEPSDYDEYHKHCIFDSVVPSVRNDLITASFNDDGHQVATIIFVTARPERNDFMKLTTIWLEKALGNIDYILLMRPSESNLPSPSLKMTLLNPMFEGRFGSAAAGWLQVSKAFDDRQDILDVYPIAAPLRSLRTLDTATGAEMLADAIRAARAMMDDAEAAMDWGTVQDASTVLKVALNKVEAQKGRKNL